MTELEELVQKQWCEPNYLIDNDCSNDEKENYTVIYFSSCGIYDSDDTESFKKQIIQKNRFEYFGTRIQKASKHIFLRDISKCWYLSGISKELNSVDALFEFLQKETKGSKIITIGASSGGFGAVLFGILLNAEYIFTFSGQYSLPQSKRLPETQYLKLCEYIKNSQIPIFYMLPIKSEFDSEQYSTVENAENVYVLSIKSSVHGIPVQKDTLLSIINSDLKDLKRMYANKNPKEISERKFICRHFGLSKAIAMVIKKNLACIKAKYL